MLNNYREVLTSLLASAMITSTLLPSSGTYNKAGAVDAGGVLRAMEVARVGLAAEGWGNPAAAKQTDFPAIAGQPVTVATLRSSETDAFQRLVAKAISINEFGALETHNTDLLGLTSGNEQFVVYQIEAIVGADAHYFNLAKDGSGRVVLFSRINKTLYAVALDAQRHPTAALVRYPGQKAIAVTIDSVRPQLHQMLGFWMDWAQQNTSVAQG